MGSGNGSPKADAPNITAAEVSWALKAWMGRILKMAKPTVRTMRHPPERIPRVMMVAQESITQKGTVKSDR